MTEKEECKLHDATTDRIIYDIIPEEELSNISAKEIVKSIDGLNKNSVKYRLYNYELKLRSIQEQHKLNEQILSKQHALNLEILREQQSSNKELSDNSNKTMVKAAIAGGVMGAIVGAVVAAVLSLAISSTNQTNDIKLEKSQTKIERTK